ncbi:MAG: phosphotransferase, partial [Planctomycetota bacterium]
RHAAQSVSFLPAPHPAETSQTAVAAHGALWEVAPWMPGEADAAALAPARLIAACEALAEFHNATRDVAVANPHAASPAIAERQSLVGDALGADWPALAERAALACEPLRAPLVTAGTLIGPVLKAVRPKLAVVAGLATRLQPIVRDSRREHFLVTGDRVTGLVDFGAMTIDTPAVDHARLLGEAAGDDPALWRLGIGASGLDATQRRLVGPLDASGAALAACNWLRWTRDGRPPDTPRLAWLVGRLRGILRGGFPLDR